MALKRYNMAPSSSAGRRRRVVAGFTVDVPLTVRSLCRCSAFQGVDPQDVLRLVMRYYGEGRGPMEAESLAEGDLVVSSGERVASLVFIQQGTIVAWQVPVSTLETPYLLGEHELLAGMTHWMATYSAYTRAQVVRLPLDLMQGLVEQHPEVRRNLQRGLFTRISRYYWTSLAVSGTNRSKVAAALVSRLALQEQDAAGGRDLMLNMSQKDLCRLTNTSRPGVSKGLKELITDGVLEMKSELYMTGRITVRDVDRLKDAAYSAFREDVLGRLPSLL